VAIYKKMRLDRLLVEAGLAPTRARAADLIRRGCVSVAGKPVLKPGVLVLPQAELAMSPGACLYVSRGALKLEAALEAFGFDPKGRVALDIGASTGASATSSSPAGRPRSMPWMSAAASSMPSSG
jgi:23S rRNA (cytidine1920-2'-O)/16S rRNA (cytidine1409-2'-O)-methyltransferase